MADRHVRSEHAKEEAELEHRVLLPVPVYP
jgi:hypothetical protein